MKNREKHSGKSTLTRMGCLILMAGFALAGTKNAVSAADIAPSVTAAPITGESYLIYDFVEIYQYPELPTGCEITAMTMAMNYYGANADKTVVASEYLPKVESPDIHVGKDGKKYGADLRSYFIGDPFSEHGYVAGCDAIVTAANNYFTANEIMLQAVNKTGMECEEMYSYIRENIPVVVWTTILMEPRKVEEGWYLEDGTYVDWASNDHGSVLIGYDDKNVTIADPIYGVAQYEKTAFESVIEERGHQCAIIERLP